MNRADTKATTAWRVDEYLQRHSGWASQLTALRNILRATVLEETVKWGMPTYTLDGKIVAGIAGFKNHCALWLHNGVFLKDPDQVLVNASQGTTRGLRQWRFGPGDAVPKDRVTAYVLEAIDNQQAGKAITPRKKTLHIPAELAAALEDPPVKAAFNALAPGKQREYADHIGGARQAQTRQSRLAKALPDILAGRGLHDRYRRARKPG